MITNPSIIENSFKCKKAIKDYLVFRCHIPMFGYDKHYFYFSYTEKLKECLEKMPLLLKISHRIGRY